MGTEVVEADELECRHVRRLQHDWARGPALQGLGPPSRADAPLIARHESGETELGGRCRQVVAVRCLELEELSGHLAAHDVHPGVVSVVLTAPGAIEPGQRFERAGNQFVTEHIALHDR